MKSIPTKSIKPKCQQENIDVMELFKGLYDDQHIEFDLTIDNNTPIFKYNKDKSVSMLSKSDKATIRNIMVINDDKIDI